MDMYAEQIIDYYTHPPNKGKIAKAEIKVREVNTLCGDEITLYIKADKKGKVTEAKFEGKGCAISQAATSMLLENLIGKKIEELKNTGEKEVIDLLGISVSPARLKCALLPLRALQNTDKYGKC
ncbi:MAG: SUF system NifU family Fe-S cluster assembly protein [Candidatus Aenigmarchaeota archaeon]|nr:SUF system NifU family Fe-S cluster assembly protein [Candidatus Aenigmarchaeota archaeon]